MNAGLPTELEWEYACRAGTETPFSFGKTISPEQVNYNGSLPYANGKKGLDRGETVELKSLPVNPWGLYEMHGNVWEWCQDGYGDYTPQQVCVVARGSLTGEACALLTAMGSRLITVTIALVSVFPLGHELPVSGSLKTKQCKSNGGRQGQARVGAAQGHDSTHCGNFCTIFLYRL